MRTRRVDKFLFKNYLLKAGEFSSAAKAAFENGMYNAVDSLAVFYKGVRHCWGEA